MNLNEECLLQFLQNDSTSLPPTADRTPLPSEDSTLAADLKRILRHKQYVSFPQAILIRRP